MDQSQVVWAPGGRLIGAGIKQRGGLMAAPVVVNGPDVLVDPVPPPVVTR